MVTWSEMELNEMKKRVLCVDDEASVLKSLTRLFRNEPFEFLTYDSPLKALTNLDIIRPTVVISDQCMSEMTGIEFLETVSQRKPDCVCMILTGHADLETAIDALNKGHIYRFIQKPWNEDDLKTQINSALKHRESALSLFTIVDILANEIRENKRTQKSLELFAEAISNELAQPLIVIDGYLQLLRVSLPNDELSNRYISNMRIQVDTIEKTVAKMKSMTQKLTAKELGKISQNQ